MLANDVNVTTAQLPRSSHAVWALRPGLTWTLESPRIMGILNVTPDSFSDGGTIRDPRHAAELAIAMLRDGADAIDVGGESTRPGAQRIGESEQVARVVPVIRAIREQSSAPITIDTTRAAVALAAIEAGADAINDVSGGTEDPEVLALAARLSRGIILMHRLTDPTRDSFSDRYGTPGQQPPPAYADVVLDVAEHLSRLAVNAINAGVHRDAIVLDPGLGFGKTVEQNLALIRGTATIAHLGFPILSGLSRKSFVGRISAPPTDPQAQDAPAPTLPTHDRLPGTLALSLAHVAAGARILRVHDVRAHAQALRATKALEQITRPGVTGHQ